MNESKSLEAETVMDWWVGQLEKVREVITTHEYWMGIVTSIGILFAHHRLKIPKIKVTGGGSGSRRLEGGEGFSLHRITVFSNPYFLGYPIKREDLLVRSARLYDPQRRRYEGHLMRWQGEPENEPYNTTIQVGQSAGLYICGIYKQRVHHYIGDNLKSIEMSETLVELGQARKLEIHITDTLGRRYKIPVRISAEERRNNAQKVQLNIRVKTTLSDRLRQIKIGVQEILGAFTRPSY